jgi:hypothetical protein
MGTDDLKSMFKAAKAQRGSGGSLVGALRLFYKGISGKIADVRPSYCTWVSAKTSVLHASLKSNSSSSELRKPQMHNKLLGQKPNAPRQLRQLLQQLQQQRNHGSRVQLACLLQRLELPLGQPLRQLAAKLL